MVSKFHFWYINFSINKYNSFDDILQIIYLLDKKMCGEKKIYGTNVIVEITKVCNLHYDYICKTNIYCDKKLIIEYLNYKFTQSENQIKFYNDVYGFDWYVEFELEHSH